MTVAPRQRTTVNWNWVEDRRRQKEHNYPHYYSPERPALIYPSFSTCHGLGDIIYLRTQIPLLPGHGLLQNATAMETNKTHQKEGPVLWDEKLTSNLKKKNDDFLQSVIILTHTQGSVLLRARNTNIEKYWSSHSLLIWSYVYTFYFYRNWF